MDCSFPHSLIVFVFCDFTGDNLVQDELSPSFDVTAGTSLLLATEGSVQDPPVTTLTEIPLDLTSGTAVVVMPEVTEAVQETGGSVTSESPAGVITNTVDEDTVEVTTEVINSITYKPSPGIVQHIEDKYVPNTAEDEILQMILEDEDASESEVIREAAVVVSLEFTTTIPATEVEMEPYEKDSLDVPSERPSDVVNVENTLDVTPDLAMTEEDTSEAIGDKAEIVPDVPELVQKTILERPEADTQEPPEEQPSDIPVDVSQGETEVVTVAPSSVFPITDTNSEGGVTPDEMAVEVSKDIGVTEDTPVLTADVTSEPVVVLLQGDDNEYTSQFTEDITPETKVGLEETEEETTESVVEPESVEEETTETSVKEPTETVSEETAKEELLKEGEDATVTEEDMVETAVDVTKETVEDKSGDATGVVEGEKEMTEGIETEDVNQTVEEGEPTVETAEEAEDTGKPREKVTESAVETTIEKLETVEEAGDEKTLEDRGEEGTPGASEEVTEEQTTVDQPEEEGTKSEVTEEAITETVDKMPPEITPVFILNPEDTEGLTPGAEMEETTELMRETSQEATVELPGDPEGEGPTETTVEKTTDLLLKVEPATEGPEPKLIAEVQKETLLEVPEVVTEAHPETTIKETSEVQEESESKLPLVTPESPKELVPEAPAKDDDDITHVGPAEVAPEDVEDISPDVAAEDPEEIFTAVEIREPYSSNEITPATGVEVTAESMKSDAVGVTEEAFPSGSFEVTTMYVVEYNNGNFPEPAKRNYEPDDNLLGNYGFGLEEEKENAVSQHRLVIVAVGVGK